MANLRRGNNDPVKMTGVFEVQNGEKFAKFTPKLVTVKSQSRTIGSKLKLISN
jgi:hypothetical protein